MLARLHARAHALPNVVRAVHNRLGVSVAVSQCRRRALMHYSIQRENGANLR